MPRKPNTPCRHPGCPKLVPSGSYYCEEHKRLHLRENSTKRGYDSKWRKARARYLKVHPLCVRCQEKGILTKATVVDHIVPHRGDKTLFWDESNWQSLCKKCHDKKTWNEDRYPEYRF